MFKHWKIMDFAPGEGRQKEVFRADYDDTLWIEAQVPGDVHSALIAAGRIPDPYYDRGESEAAWMEQREFWYRGKFQPGGSPAKDERVLLTFHGLDTFAVIYLNGVLLGRAQNMFREFVFDVTGKLLWGKTNTLALRFDPPLSKVDPENPFRSTWGRSPERVFMRKAQFGFGWDWAPRLPSVGIWRPVEIKRHHTAALLGTHFNTLRLAPDHSSALVMVRVEASRFIQADKGAKSAGKLKAEIRLSIPGEKKPVLDESIPLESADSLQDVTATFTLDHPRLWWPNGIREPNGSHEDEGAAFLYDLRVTLRRGKDVLDVLEQQVGVRTLSLDQSPDPDEPGTRFFRFVVNGAPLFAKGANWVPADALPGRVEAERIERLLRIASDGNINMLRVMGAGIYEQDAFYQTCDRLGILVWQDFMFANGMYPENNLMFNAEVEAEARFQVRRLRSHPSLALWCGNNESQWLHDRSQPERFPEKVPGSLYYDAILPGAVRELDGFTPYWPGSPYGGSDYNSLEDGDHHHYPLWHAEQPRRFGEPLHNSTPLPAGRAPQSIDPRSTDGDLGRFISDFGLPASPALETLRRVIPEEQHLLHSPSLDQRNKHNPRHKGDHLMAATTGQPRDFEEYVDFSMITQAEGLKLAIEHYRRRSPHCSGALVRQFNDCWPAISASLVDYYGFAKAGYYYTSRAFSPVLASFQQDSEGVSLWISSDRLEPCSGACAVRLVTFAGEMLWEQPVQFELPPHASLPVASWPLESLLGLENPAGRCLLVRSADGLFPPNRHFFAAVKDLQRPPSAPVVRIKAVNEHEVNVGLRAKDYVYFFHLTHPSEFTQYEDNYFDIAPGEEGVIRVWNEKQPLKVEEIQAGWR